MPKLEHLQKGIDMLAISMNPPAPEPEPEPEPIKVEMPEITIPPADYSELVKALGKMQETHTKALRAVVDRINRRDDDKELIAALNGVMKAVDSMSKVVSSMGKQEPVTVEVEKPGPTTFRIERDEDGRMRNVVATPGEPEKAKPDEPEIE